MRFPNVKIKRRIGKKTFIWLHLNDRDDRILVDYGFSYGNIHIYKFEKTISGNDLKDFLESKLEGFELGAGSNVDVLDLGDCRINSELFSPDRKNN